MRFVLRRLLLFVVALLAISVAVFAMLRILPGDVAAVMAGVNSPPERVAQLRAELGLDRPLAVQYLDWCANLLHGDLGAPCSPAVRSASRWGYGPPSPSR